MYEPQSKVNGFSNTETVFSVLCRLTTIFSTTHDSIKLGKVTHADLKHENGAGPHACSVYNDYMLAMVYNVTNTNM